MRRFLDDVAMGAYAARCIRETVTQKPDALICIAAGTTSLPVFEAVLSDVRAGKVSFGRASFIAMDEWLGIPQDADGAMAAFLRHNFLDAAGFADVFLFDGIGDPKAECARAERFLAEKGGIDLAVFGIGVNGHVALNEPGVNPSLRTHIAEIAPITVQVAQKYFEQAAPPLQTGVTLGLQNAAEAGRVLLIANTAKKRSVVERIETLLECGTPSPEVPASIVAALPQAELLVTEAVFA